MSDEIILITNGDMTINRPIRGQDPRKNTGPNINDQIKALEVRLVGEDGEMFGVVAIRDAIQKAEDAGLDLVEISPNAAPPVCKMLNYGKFKYEQQKKAAEAKKKQKIVELKEVKIRPTTEEHDYQVKLRNARRFLTAGNKVKFSMRFRGREMAHQEVGMKVMLRLKADVSDIGVVDLHPKMEGRQMLMIISAETP